MFRFAAAAVSAVLPLTFAPTAAAETPARAKLYVGYGISPGPYSYVTDSALGMWAICLDELCDLNNPRSGLAYYQTTKGERGYFNVPAYALYVQTLGLTLSPL